MQFTPRDVIQGARDRSPRPRDVTLTPDQSARQFNDILLDLVHFYLDRDFERLAEAVTIPDTDVDAGNPFDVTMSTTIEWLNIHGIDHRTAAGEDYEDEVIIVPQEARTRARHEYQHLELPIGYFIDRERSIFKLHGWDGVYDIQIYGTLAPTKISVGDWLTVFDYPAPLYRVLQLQFAANLAGPLALAGDPLQLIVNDLQDARQRMEADAEEHVSGDLRVEDVPHVGFYH